MGPCPAPSTLTSLAAALHRRVVACAMALVVLVASVVHVLPGACCGMMDSTECSHTVAPSGCCGAPQPVEAPAPVPLPCNEVCSKWVASMHLGVVTSTQSQMIPPPPALPVESLAGLSFPLVRAPSLVVAQSGSPPWYSPSLHLWNSILRC